MHRGGGCRDRGSEIAQDRLDVGERGAGEVTGGDVGLQARLHRLQVVDTANNAAGALAALPAPTACCHRPPTSARVASLKVAPSCAKSAAAAASAGAGVMVVVSTGVGVTDAGGVGRSN